MGLFRSLFGPSKDEIWGQVANSIGGEFIDGGFWGGDELRYQAGEWELLLDTYTVSNGKSSTTYTRLRVPFINQDALHFKIYKTGFFSGVGKWFGMQDMEIGDSYFDDDYIIKGNDQDKLKLLLSSEELKSAIRTQPRISIEIKRDEGFFGKSYPDGVDLLYFSCVGVIKDTAVLRDLFELFTILLERLVQIDSAYEDDPNVRL